MSFDPISAGLEFAGKVVDRIWPDATEKQKADRRLKDFEELAPYPCLSSLQTR